MAAGICLMKDTADKFIQAVKDGEVDPSKLAGMTSAERNEYLGKIVGENHATAVNSLFESKLLLKNQKKGMVTWAKQVSGIKPEVRRDMIKKIEDLQNVLDPADQKQFMHDLTSTRLGISVSADEAKHIANLSKKVTELESLRKPDKTFPSESDRMNYGRAIEDLTDYVAGLKQDTDKIHLSDLKPSNVRENPGILGKFANRAAGNAKSINASMDNSAIFRQGWKTLMTHPGIWQKNAKQTFVTIVKQFGGKNVLREVNADIISRPTYDAMVKAKLAIKNPEEAFPESLAEKVPVLGRAYKATEAAYTAFVYKTRADVFDKYLQSAKDSGVDISDKTNLEAIGKMVNSLTGRGNLGRLEPIANTINNAFFSPRFLKSNIDTLLAPGKLIAGKDPMFVRKQAALNTLKIIAGTATILATAEALRPGSVEFDPRSSNFGKIKIGDTAFDVSGGVNTIITLAARIATLSTKSTTTGIVTKLNSGAYGSETGLDVVTNFLTGKASPALSVLIDRLKGQDFNGNKPTVANEAKNAFSPMGLQNYEQLKNDPNSANKLVALIADGLGISASNNAPNGRNGQSSWSKSTSKELTQFKQSVGTSRFNAAATKYDNQFNAWMSNVQNNPAYKSMSSDDQKTLITKKKAALKSNIFKANGFKYKKQKGTVNKSLL